MSSIPVRRTTRATRATKDNENAVVAARASSRLTSRAKSTVGDVGVTRPTLASKAKTAMTNEPASKEPTGTKRKRAALLEVTTKVTNHTNLNAGGSAVAKAEGKTGVSGAGAKAKTTVKPSASRNGRLPSDVVAAKRERVPRAGSESATSTKADAELVESKTSAGPSESADEKMEVDDPPAKLPRIQETVEDDEEVERVFKKRHTDVVKDSQAEADKVAAELQAADLSPIQLWDDLDADDWDDPLMVSEYVTDVYDYLKEIELATMPRSDYMKDQQEITWEHRATLIDWLLQVHARFGLLQESLFLTVNLIDRFLGLRTISVCKLQLVGLACFFIATKYEETYAPSVKEIVDLASGLYRPEELLKAEKYILKTLDWDLRAPGPLGWLRRGSKADDCEVNARTVAKYLIEISCLERTLIGVVPSMISAAALWLARLTLGREFWTANLEHYTTYSEQELLPIASIMLEYIITDPIPHESLYKKYAHKRYKRCSIFMREWSLSRWVENGSINLRKELAGIKAEIMEIRASLEAEGR